MSAPLVRRQIARLWADRSLSLGLALGGLALVVGGAAVWAMSRTGDLGPDRMRALVWNRAFGMYGAVLLVLAITAGSLQVGGDLKRGTLLSVLARPVSRQRVFLAGWAGTALVLLALEALRGVLGIASVLGFGGSMDGPGLLGLAADAAGTLLVLALFAALGAALPPGAAVGAGIVVLLVPALAWGGWPFAGWVRPLAWLLPVTAGQDEAIQRALAGAGGDALLLAEALAYRLCWTAALLALGCRAFARRDLSPR